MSAQQIITFDSQGISQHPNHIALSTLSTVSLPNIRILHLASPSLLAKYTGPVQAILWATGRRISTVMAQLESSPVLATIHPVLPKLLYRLREALDFNANPQLHFVVNPISGYWTALRAMWQHRSQMVWFRYLYLIFSSTMWLNTLVVQ